MESTFEIYVVALRDKSLIQLSVWLISDCEHNLHVATLGKAIFSADFQYLFNQ